MIQIPPILQKHLSFSLLVVTTITSILVSLLCLQAGYTIIFQNLFYFPILIACILYLWRGFFFSCLITLIYIGLVIWYIQDPVIVVQALFRVVIFIVVAGVVAFLAVTNKRSEERMHQLSEFQKDIIANARVWLTVLDTKSTILAWNTAAEDISGYQSEEVIGKNDIWKLLYPEQTYRRQITDTITRIIREKNYLEAFETSIHTKQGTVRTISWNTKGITDEKGVISSFIAIGVDITDQKQVEKDLKFSEEKFAAAFTASPNPIAITDIEDGTILDANQAFEEWSGYKREELVNKRKKDLHIWVYPEERDSCIRKILDGEEVRKKQVTFQTKQENNRDILFSARAIQVGNKKYLLSVTEDVTEYNKIEQERVQLNNELIENNEQLQSAFEELMATEEELRYQYNTLASTEESLRQTKEYLENLISIANVPILIWDSSFRINRINRAAEILIGCSAEEVLGNSLDVLFPPSHRERSMRLIQTTLDGVRWETVELEILHRNGTIRTVIWNSSTLYSSDGVTPIATIAQGQDITTQRQLEQEKNEAFIQIQQNLAQLAILNDEIRNPLNIILIYVEMLGDSSAMELITSQIKRIDEMVTELDTKWINSEKVLTFLRRHYQISPILLTGQNELALKSEEQPGDERDPISGRKSKILVEEAQAALFIILDSIDALVYVADMNTHDLLFVNQRGRNIFGGISGQKCYKALQKDQDGPCPFCTNHLLTDSFGPTGVYKWESQNTKNNRWYDCRDRAILWSDGRLVRLEIATDITDRKRNEEALLKSEHMYRLFAENTSDVIWTMNLDGEFTYVSPTAFQLRGYTAEEVMCQQLEEIITPDTLPIAQEELKKLTVEGRQGIFGPPKVVEVEQIRKDGSTVWTEICAHLVKDETNDSILILGVARNVSDRKRADDFLRIQLTLIQALTTSHTLKEALNYILDAALCVDGLDSGGVYVVDQNTGAVDLTVHRGLSPEFVELTSHFDADAPQVLRAKTGEAYYGRYTDLRQPGIDEIRDRERVTGIASIPVLYEDNLIAIMNMASHVLDDFPEHTRKMLETIAAQISDTLADIHMEEELREYQRRLADIIHFLPDATLAIDREKRIIIWNKAIEEMTGIPAAEMIGKGDYAYTIPFYGEARPQLMDLVFEDDTVITARYPTIIREGNTLIAEVFCNALYNNTGAWVFAKASPLYDSSGGIIGAIESIRDITDRKSVEEEITFKNVILSTQQETTLDGILIVDEAGKILQYNQKFIEIWGIPNHLIESRIDEPILQFVTKQLIDPDVFLSRVRYLYDHKEEKSFEELVLKDGRILERFSAPMLGNDGTYFGRIWYFKEITDRKRAEESLQKSEERYRAVVEDQTELICRFTPDGRLTFVNGAYCRYFNLDKNLCLSKLHSVELPPEDAILMKQHLLSLSQENPVAYIEHRIHMQDGTIKWQRWNDRAIFGKDGHIIEYQSVGRDITEMKTVEEALLKSGKNYRALFETTGTAIVLIENDGMISLANSEFEKLSRYSKEEIENKKTWMEFVVKEDLDRMLTQHQLRRQNHEKAYTHYEFRFRSRFGDIHNISLTIDIIPGTLQSVASLIDITERKQIEEALRQANRQLSLLTQITRHDINNNLSIILSSLEIAENTCNDPELEKYFEMIESATNSIESQIEFTQVYQDLGSHEPQWQRLDAVMPYFYVPETIHLITDVVGVEVYANPMLGRVFFNLLDNSLRHGETVREIRVSYHQLEKRLIITWEDDGVGIPVDLKEKIFERGVGKNTGLGLFLVREILMITGMTIQETGDPGKGARFEIIVPNGKYRYI